MHMSKLAVALKQFFCLFFLFVNVQVISAKKPQGKVEHPNVILVMTDDQGYGDIAAHGNKIIKTPNLDKLHDQSIRLTNFHAGTTCAPSRSGLMSGMEGHRAGVWHTIGGCNLLREKYIAMPQVFKNNGYATAMFGKWHLGDAYPYLPGNRGFDETVVHGAGGIGQTPDYWDNDYFDDTYMHNGKAQKYKGYCTDVFFNEAIKYIEAKKDEPFFVYLSTNAPHGPLNVPRKYYDMYKDETQINEEQKAYYGMITNIDENIGILVNKLRELNLMENTILIFTTDNGTQNGYRVVNGKEFGYNAGMKGLKGSPYEGGHRVPFFICWENGMLNNGRDIDKLIMNYDILPTLIDLCSLQKPTQSKYDGRSIAPLLEQTNAEWPHRYAVVDKNKSQHPQKWKECSVMDGNWRLIRGKELYDLTTDPGQNNDISAQYPERVKAMRAYYEKWWNEISQDFDQYEAYKIGAPGFEETAFTVHDMHSDSPLAWEQSYIRDPFSGKKPALAESSFWMIDVVQAGDYEVAIARWPRESGLKFNDTPKQLGKVKPWYAARPAGVRLDIVKAALEVKGKKQEQTVKMDSKEVVFRIWLDKGRQQFKASFIDSEGKDFGAFYVYIKKL